jgi:hypothetical protein
MATEQEFFGEAEVNKPAVSTSSAPEEVVKEKPSVSQNLTPNEFFGAEEVQFYKPKDQDENLNFAERVGQDIKKRLAMGKEIVAAVESGEQSTAEGFLQVAGKVGAGSVLDFIGEAVVSAGKGLSAITPDIIEKPLKEGATAAGHMLLNTDIGHAGLNAARKGMDAWSEFADKNPRAARNIEAVVDIALLAAPVKGKPKVSTQPTLIGKAGEVLEKKAVAQEAVIKQDFVDKLIRPKETAAVKVEQVARTEESGLLKTKEVVPSSSEKQIAAEVAKVPEVEQSKTLQGNYNAVADEVSKEAGILKAALEKKDVIFPKKEFNAQLDAAMTRLQDHPLLVGDAQKTAERIVDKMTQIVGVKKSTVSNLLAARKELDSWIKSQKGPNIFDPKQEGAISIAIREIRHTTNDFIDSKVTNIGVKESLKKQSTLLRAMENIAPKAADEAGNAVLRAWQNIHRILPLRGEFNQSMAVLFGVGGLGAAAIFAPFFTKLALGSFAVYELGKVIIGPNAKKGLSILLKTTDEAIRKAKDERLIQQLRLDRSAVLELLEVSGEKLEETNNESNPAKAD